jgi:hypothetical protein
MDTIETIKYRHHKIEFYADEDYDFNPRTDMDNLGIMICFHKRYDLGDNVYDLSSNDFKGWDELESYIAKKLHGVLIMPLYMLDHSGLTISTNDFHDPWDSGQIGFIFTTREKIRECYMKKHISEKTMKRAEKVLLCEVTMYDQYLRGEVYGYEIFDTKGKSVESVSGHFGWDWVKEAAMDAVDSLIEGPKPNRSWVRQENAKKQPRDSKGHFIKKGEHQ